MPDTVSDSKVRKITRSRKGCFTCKKRRRKCDETKPHCMNCVNSGRQCEGYGLRLVFDVDDSRSFGMNYRKSSLGLSGGGGGGGIAEIKQGPEHELPSTPSPSAVSLSTSSSMDSLASLPKAGFRGRPKASEYSPRYIYNTSNLNPLSISKDTMKKKFHPDKTIDTTSLTVPLPMSPQIVKYSPNDNGNHLPVLMSRAPMMNHALSTTGTTVSSNSDNFDLDFDNEQQFEHAFFSGLDYILDNYDTELINSINSQFPQDLPLNLLSPLQRDEPGQQKKIEQEQAQGRGQISNIKSQPGGYASVVAQSTNVHDTTMKNLSRSKIPYVYNSNDTLDVDANKLAPQLKKKEETQILKHFFEKVIYLLDAHPQTPWPQLMMNFGSMDLAKSCFLSLSSMHLYVNNGGDEFYKKGLLHINNTMEYLIKYVKTGGTGVTNTNAGTDHKKDENIISESEETVSAAPTVRDGIEVEQSEVGLNVPKIIDKIKHESNRKKGTNFMVILLLLYVHLLFAVLESGRSALARMFLKLASSIADDPIFNKQMKKIKESQSLLCVLSWFDTVSSLVSPDCRVPYCDPKWFGESNDIISTDKMNGCPVGVFRTLYDTCLYRHDTMKLFSVDNGSSRQVLLSDIKQNYKMLLDLRDRFLHYRDHVLYELPHGSTFTYIDRLKCAQLWALAGILVTIQLEMHYFSKLPQWIEQNRNYLSITELPESVPSKHIYSTRTTTLITEFLSVYNTIPAESPIITQMVWPIFYVGVCSREEENRKLSWNALKTLYETVKMGTIKSNMNIVEKSWKEGVSIESILAGPGWLENGIDLLPC
jgi:hypothetical protein